LSSADGDRIDLAEIDEGMEEHNKEIQCYSIKFSSILWCRNDVASHSGLHQKGWHVHTDV
jgi:hypothetical protein